MIVIKSDHEIKIMREAGKVTAQVLEKLGNALKPGITTLELDKIAEEEIIRQNMFPAFKGYNGFPASICVSINEQVVHGIPSERMIREGDIVSIDVGVRYQGYHGDAARTFSVGAVTDEAKKLIQVTEKSFFEGLKYCKKEFRLSDISNAIQNYVESEGFSIVKDFVGHGIGRDMHEDPQIPNYGKPGRGPRLAEGMVFAIEPMVNAGTDQVTVLLDNWTVVTDDAKLSAHYENTVLITDGEPEILTII
ncbi:MAG: type I methionyl aminopeptidase [Clostridiales bacterium]|nr:type I methionyl aminopeptidase [Clostridiales bacterium]